MNNKKEAALSAIAVGGLSIVGVLGSSAVQGSPLENILLPIICAAVVSGTILILYKSK